MGYILGIDLGTTAIKAAVFDENGRICGSRTHEYTLLTPSALVVELDAETYIRAFKAAVHAAIREADILAESIEALGISAQGETLFFLDKEGQPLRNAIVWMDNRANAEAEELERALGGRETVHKTTGQVSMCATWPASKILWVKKHEPEIFARIGKLLLIEDYFIYLMTGKFVSEDSLLCSTMLWDINTRKYWPEMLSLLGIAETQLPEIHSPGTPVAKVSPEGAKLLGLSENTLVCLGGLDQACGAIGVGNVRPGIFSESTGAAMATVAITDQPVFDPSGEMPCFAGGIPGTYMIHSFSTGGMVMRWFRDAFCACETEVERQSGVNAYSIIDAMVETVKPGSEGMLMVPHLQGSGPPDSNSQAKGVFFGVTLAHTKAHFARAIMEGVTMVMLRMKEATENLGAAVTEIRSLSGGAKSRAWCQIKADAAGLPVRTMKNTENAACLGAAILAGVGAGIWADIAATAEKFTESDLEFTPNTANKEIYDKILGSYKALLRELAPAFGRN